MDKLIKDKDIEVDATDIISGIKANRVDNIVVRDQRGPNFYSLVIMYLKQNLHRTVKAPTIISVKKQTIVAPSQPTQQVKQVDIGLDDDLDQVFGSQKVGAENSDSNSIDEELEEEVRQFGSEIASGGLYKSAIDRKTLLDMAGGIDKSNVKSFERQLVLLKLIFMTLFTSLLYVEKRGVNK
jgi:hypothetical protein